MDKDINDYNSRISKIRNIKLLRLPEREIYIFLGIISVDNVGDGLIRYHYKGINQVILDNKNKYIAILESIAYNIEDFIKVFNIYYNIDISDYKIEII